MFCPKCGNELPEGAKFCATCGKQMIKEGAVESRLQNNSTNEVAWKKPIIVGVIAIVAVLAIVLIIKAISKPSDSKETGKTETIFSKNTKSGFDSYEDAIDSLFTAAYNKDVKAVVNCFPKEMESYVKTLYNAYHTACESGSGWSGELLNYTTGNFFGFENLNMENEYWYEIGEATELEQSELLERAESDALIYPSYVPSVFTKERLQSEYGLTFDEAYIVEVKSMAKYYTEMLGTAGYSTEGSKGSFEVAKIDGKWYVLRIDDVWISAWYE